MEKGLLFFLCAIINGSMGSLTGNGQKYWQLATNSVSLIDCVAVNIVSDNSYVFRTDGTFEFDHGTITEDPTCKESCCSDMANLIGTWQLTNNNTHLIVKIQRTKENNESVLDFTLIDADIVQLDEDILKISQKDPTGAVQTLEFHKK